MSNVLKSHRICVNPESRFTLQKRMHFAVSMDTSNIPGQTVNPVERIAEIEMVKRDAEAIRHKAQEEAKTIIAEATKEAQRIKEQAREAGFQAGFQKGLEDAQKQFLSEIDEVQRMKEEVIREREMLYKQFEQDIVALALDIAKRAIYDRLETDDEALAQLIESTLRKIQGRVKVQLKVSKQDYDRIGQLKERFLAKLPHIEDMDIVADDFLSSGSCVVDTGRGIVDGSVDTRIREIEAVLVRH
ncbi:flagellar assembly protein FliH [Caldicoprobacter guelmensis]|uniref:FliH/SctL family protein n=1 Tax=Caldicoprobacter guelmensis TaxID=1170224 RepID=UPI00195EF9AA|nr:FliH/SctL family protein [Caldicoprobacter guelmensis]MBM7581378.1 flagellar assembly protein FliH [Caldicoprobacter guelmensis]